MADIDSLDIKIYADASKAVGALDKVSSALDTLDTKLGGINTGKVAQLNNEFKALATSLQGVTVGKGSQIYGLAKDLRSLTKIDGSNLNSLSNTLNQFAKDISQLSDTSNTVTQLNTLSNALRTLGYKSTDKAITNIPILTKELMNMFNVLSKAPAISNNTIRMTNALARLASQGSKVGTASKSLNNAMNKTNSIFDKTRKKTFSLASAIGKFYATYFMVIRGVKGLGNAVKSSMDYLETLNYFNVAFEQVAQSGIGNWEQAGYESAEAYAKSFSERARQLTSKMSGFTPTDDGTLQATGSKSLGINATQMMNYQAMFGQMSSSMGVASETSLKLSDALTRIGADLASVKNMDFDKVWTDMASGLAGMSKTMDKYGVNIRNVNLQQKLFDLGINANITNLNQNEKALLRAIILLDTTRYAWSDLAETLNSPSNQLRLLSANFKMLSQMIGNLFLPVVAKVLPFINALVIAIQRLVTWFGNLIGIDLSGITNSMGGSNEIMSDLADEADSLASGLGDATKQAKEFNKQTRGWDELNNLTSKQDSGSGDVGGSGIGAGVLEGAFDKIYEEYTKAWDEAFKQLDNKAQQVADKIEKYFAPLKSMISNIFKGDFESAGKDFSGIITGILRSIDKGLEKVKWKEIGNNIGDFLKGIEWLEILKSVGDVIWEAVKGAIELAIGVSESLPLESSIITFFSLMKFTGLGDVLLIPLKPIFTSLGNTLASTTVLSFSGMLKSTTLWTTGLSTLFGTGSLSIIGTTLFAGFVGALAAGFAGFNFGVWLRDNITWGDKSLGERIEEMWFSFFTSWLNFKDEWNKSWQITFDEWGKNFEALSEWFEETWSNFCKWFSTTWNDVSSSFKTIWGNALNFVVNGLKNWWNNSIVPAFTKAKWLSIFNNIKTSLKETWDTTITWVNNKITTWWNTNIKPMFSKSSWNFSGIKDGLKEAFDNGIRAIKDIWNNFANWINPKLTWEIPKVEFAGKTITNGGTISLGHLPTFQNGGFVEDGLFMANHNELVGQFSNGKTAVANNEMITDGIYNAVRDAVYELVTTTEQSNRLLEIIADKEFGISANEIFRSVRKSAYNYVQTTGNPAF